MLTATFEVLADAGYMKGEERIDRHKIAFDSMELLLAKPVNELDAEVIERQASTVQEVRAALFAENGYSEEVEKDLDALVAQIIAGDGKVQQLLDSQSGDKYVLCSKRVTRQVIDSNGNVTMTIKRSGKFVSRDPDVINLHYWQEAFSRYERSTETLKKRIVLGRTRQPELVARAPALIKQAHDHLQLALPMETGGE